MPNDDIAMQMRSDMTAEQDILGRTFLDEIPLVASMADIPGIKRIPFSARQLPPSIFDALGKGATH